MSVTGQPNAGGGRGRHWWCGGGGWGGENGAGPVTAIRGEPPRGKRIIKGLSSPGGVVGGKRRRVNVCRSVYQTQS